MIVPFRTGVCVFIYDTGIVVIILSFSPENIYWQNT